MRTADCHGTAWTVLAAVAATLALRQSPPMAFRVAEELLERSIVRDDRGDIDVLGGAVQAVTADAEDDSIDAPLVVEARVRGAVLAKEVAVVALASYDLLKHAHLRAVPVGVARRIGVIDERCDTRLAKGRQMLGDLLGGLAA